MTQPVNRPRPWPFRRQHQQSIIRWAGHLLALYPFLLLLWHYQHNQLGADPIREILLRTGEPALVFLILSLAITPLMSLFGWKQLFPLRRLFGLYSFFYVLLHLLTFVWLDYGLDWRFILDGIAKQNFVLAGLAAFFLLLPLALTSSKWAQRRLGQRWRLLHKLVYVAILLALLHFWWLVKHVYYMPFFYSLVVCLLLLLRWSPVRQKALAWRRRWQAARLGKRADSSVEL